MSFQPGGLRHACEAASSCFKVNERGTADANEGKALLPEQLVYLQRVAMHTFAYRSAWTEVAKEGGMNQAKTRLARAIKRISKP